MTAMTINDFVLCTEGIHVVGFMVVEHARLKVQKYTAHDDDDTEDVIQQLCNLLGCRYEDCIAECLNGDHCMTWLQCIGALSPELLHPSRAICPVKRPYPRCAFNTARSLAGWRLDTDTHDDTWAVACLL
jgi:hypothetical protein